MTNVSQVVQLLFTGKDQGVSQALNKIGTASKATAAAATSLNRAFSTALAFGIAKLSGDFLIQLGKSVDTTGEFTAALDEVHDAVGEIVRELLPDMSKVLQTIAEFISRNKRVFVGVFQSLLWIVEKLGVALNWVLEQLGVFKAGGIDELDQEIERLTQNLELLQKYRDNPPRSEADGFSGQFLSLDQQEEVVRRQLELVKKQRDVEQRFLDNTRSVDGEVPGGKDQTEDLERAISFTDRLRAAFAAASDVAGQATQLIVNGVRRVASAIGDAIDGAKSWEEGFREVAKSIVKQLRDIFIEYLLIQAAQAALGGGATRQITGATTTAGVSTAGSGGGGLLQSAGGGVRLIQQVTIQAVDAKSVQRLFAENSRALADVQTASLQRYSGLRLSTRRA